MKSTSIKEPGVRRHVLSAIAASLIATAMQGSLQAQAVSNRLFAENFDSLPLGPNREESLAGLEVWTGTPPSGWELDNSQMPGFGTANDGMVEWAGWTFANKDWWVRAAGNQRRAEWAFGDNTVMIADPDEWDDQGHAKGLFNSYIALPAINVTGAAANSLVVAFDSTWRPEAFDDGGANWPVDENGRPINHQNGVVDVAFDGGANKRVVDFDSDSESPNFKKDVDFINESVVVPLNNPAGAKTMNVRFGMLTAANDWWWAVDNIAVGVPPLLSSVTGNGVAVTNRIVEALGKTVNTAAGVTVTVNGKAATPVEVTKALVNDNYPESERVFVSHTGTQVFAPRSRVAVTVRFTDNTGRVVEESGSFIAPGYLTLSTTPKVITAVLTDAAWMTVKDSAGVKLELNGTSITATSVTRVDNTVVVRYVSPSLIPSGSRHTLKATYTTASGQELTETVGFTASKFETLSAELATAVGTGTEAGMNWRTHQLAAGRPGGTVLSAAESQLAGALGASEHDASGEVGGIFKIDYVNFDQASGEAGNFKGSGLGELAVNDEGIPGIPGVNGSTDNIVGEVLTFVEVPAAGLYTMVVNSDDGFQVSVGTTNNVKSQVLGEFNGGRGSSDTQFYFEATKAGVYLFRLLWMEGGGGANVEWFTVNADGTRALVNGTQAGALRTFRRRTVAEPVLPVSNRLFAENFDSLPLGPNREESLAGLEVWTGTPPSGWVLDNSQMPGFGTANDGMVEWAGWTFANKDWWVRAAGNQRRAEFAFGDNTVMIADPDEWDDQGHAKGLFNSYIALPAINVTGAAANSLVVAFDSTWRPEAFDDGGANWPVDENGRPINNQNGVVDASFDGGANKRVVDFDSDSQSPNFKKDIDFINESVVVPLNNPAGATTMNVRFGMLTAANDWWWAVDNIAVGVPPLLSSVTGSGVAVTNRIVEALGKTVNTAAGVTVTVNGKAATPVEVTKALVNDNYPESERVFVSHTGTQVFAPRSRVAVTVRFTDNTGRVVQESGEFIAPGYMTVSTTPKEITAVLTDAAWMTVKDSAGVKLELNGTAITATSVTRVDNTVVVRYVSPSLIPSGSRHSLKATYTTASGQELTETVGFTAAKYETLSAELATAVGTGTEAGMNWRTHQLAAGRPGGTVLSAAESQLAGALGASEHDASGEVGGIFKIDYVNFDQASGEAGNFKGSGLGELAVNDEGIPGIPGVNGSTDNIVGEVLTFVEVPAAGLYTMVVNSDDGFQVSVGTTNNVKSQVLGEFNGGRGSSDTQFYFEATKAGVYLFRLLWMEGGGGANVEWFTVNANGTRALVNGTQAGALRTFRRRTVAEPGGGSTTPLAFSSIVRNANGSITLTWTGGGTLQSSASIQGPWTDVAGATSPLTLTADQASQFARLRR